MNRPTTLRAMRATGPRGGLHLEETPLRALAEHEALIKATNG